MDAAVQTSLSGDQVNKLAGGGCRVVRYPDLDEFSSWHELMSTPAQAVIILFLVESESEGHWICAFNGPDGAHVFDPLGYALDGELKRLTPEKRHELGQTEPMLGRLVKTAGAPVHVSRNDFQTDKPGINTCGRWVALRIQNKDLTDAQFTDFVKRGIMATGLKPDAWVVVASKHAAGEPDTSPDAAVGGSFFSHERLRRARERVVSARLQKVARPPARRRASSSSSSCSSSSSSSSESD